MLTTEFLGRRELALAVSDIENDREVAVCNVIYSRIFREASAELET